MAFLPPLTIDRDARTPLYRQLEQELRRAILDGRLRPGMRLPSVRELASLLGVARVTVAEAYSQLAAEAYLVAAVGSGTRVAPSLPDQTLFPLAATSAARVHPLVRRLGSADEGVSPTVGPGGARSVLVPPLFDLRPGRPALDLFPTTLWERLLRDAWRQVSRHPHGCSALVGAAPGGYEPLRVALAGFIGVAKSIRCAPDDLVITAGGTMGMSTALRLATEVHVCAVEDPGRAVVAPLLKSVGVRTLPIRAGVNGLDPIDVPAGVDAVFVNPAWRYPTGGSMPLTRRRALIDWGRTHRGVIFEADFDSQVRYHGYPLPAIKSLDDTDRVVFLGSLEDLMFPGFSVGYAIVPGWAAHRRSAAIEMEDLRNPTIEQIALAWFFNEGQFERHLRRLRLAYLDRQEVLLEAMKRACGDLIALDAVEAGTHLVATLTEPGVKARTIQQEARGNGVLVGVLSDCRSTSAPDRELLLGFGGSKPTELRAAAVALGSSIRRCVRERAS
jgi:GntR family transcriptional regulator / MocR family aminotransferase